MSRFHRIGFISLLLGFSSSQLLAVPSIQAQSKTYSVNLIRTKDSPTMAIVQGKGIRESYILGCPALQNLWSVVYVQGRKTTKVTTVDSKQYSEAQKKYPLAATLPCDGSVQGYLPIGESGVLVIKHRDGKLYRHYVDDMEWMTAIRAKSPASITPEELKQLAPIEVLIFVQ